MNVLIVEDSDKVRESLVNLISSTCKDCNINESSTISEANELITSNKFDLSILDINLPDGSGIDLIAPLKNLNCKNVIIFSNSASNLVRSKCTALGADQVFDKSSEFEELLSFLEDLQPTL